MTASPPVELDLAQFKSTVPGPFDLFVCCASFEERCLSIAKQVDPSGVRSVIVIENDGIPGAHKNADVLASRFGASTQRVFVRRDDPILSADKMSAALAAAPLGSRILVDISTFTHEHLLILHGILNQVRGQLVTFVYAGASEYMLGEDKWLSRGICDIRSVLGYPGLLLPSEEVHLIVLVGFELDRAQRLVEVYEPAVVSLGYASKTESLSPEHFETNRAFHRRLAARLNGVHEFTFSCRNAVATKQAILEQVDQFRGYGPVVAPMNTKVSTLGAALAAHANSRIQLCYAQADRYNTDGYSSPGNGFYIVEAPLQAAG